MRGSLLLIHLFSYRWLVLLLWRKTAFKPGIVNCKARPKRLQWPKVVWPLWPQLRTFSVAWALALMAAQLLRAIMSQVRQQQPMDTIIWIIIQGIIKILVKWPIPPNSTHIIWPVLALRPFSAPDQQRRLSLKISERSKKKSPPINWFQFLLDIYKYMYKYYLLYSCAIVVL